MERRRSVRLDLADPMTKTVRRRDRPRERWLLTRKTWKYMSDAGRRLIPDGAQNRLEDVPRIEAYFQDVCQKEPRFLLWRKSSYPGVLPKPRRKKRPRGGSVRARSPSDDARLPLTRPTDLLIPHTSGGRFDIAKLRRDFFAAPPPSQTPSQFPFSILNASLNNGSSSTADDEGVLVDLLRKYLKIEDNKVPPRISESEELINALRNYLNRQSDRGPTDSEADPTHRTLREHLSRHHSGSSNRDNLVQDLLNDRHSLRNLYHDLRKPKPYRGGRSGGYSGVSFTPVGVSGQNTRSCSKNRAGNGDKYYEDYLHGSPKSPPPLIEVYGESLEDRLLDVATQTPPLSEEVLLEIEKLYREKIDAATTPTSPTSPPPERRPRRRSSVDHDDVSQSVSDTIKRYLRMARKKSVDSEKTDRFKRINYDKNLRNIKPRPANDVDDDGLHKGCQTDEAWILSYRDVHFASVASTPTSPPSPTHSHSFLSTLLGKNATVSPHAGVMQKSRSSSSVVQSVRKSLWRTRSRSSSRAVAAWSPQGSCCWTDGSGRCVRLVDTSALTLSEVERKALQQAALARLQQLNLGTNIKIPDENASTAPTKPKRRPYLLKRKALTTGFFDQSRAKDADKDNKESSGSVFGVPLAQCVEADRALRRQQHGGSRASLASLGALDKGDDSESCDSGEWGWSGVEDGSGGPKVPSIVSACLSHLRRHGLRTVGLFRVSASKKRVRQLREEWESGHEAALDSAVCPHDVATLLKEFLRDLPDPLLCRELYSAFLQTQKIRNRRIQWEALRLIVQLLPVAHRDTLHALLTFLSLLASNASYSEDSRQAGNKMDAANIATIFAPTILHKSKPNEAASTDQLCDREDVIDVVRQLVERHAELWALPAELLHEAYIHLQHAAPAHLDSLLLRRAECAAESANSSSDQSKRLWSREAFLHAATTTSTSSSSRQTERAGAGGLPTHDSNDSASDYTETGIGSEDECVITASLHIPVVRARRRSASGSSSGKRDSAAGSWSPPSAPSTASSASPPSSPPPPAPSHTRLVALGRERHTSDARAVVVRQHDEHVTRSRVAARSGDVTRTEHAVRREEHSRRDESRVRRGDIVVRREETVKKEERREGTTLYKRGELISSARSPPA